MSRINLHVSWFPYFTSLRVLVLVLIMYMIMDVLTEVDEMRWDGVGWDRSIQVGGSIELIRSRA